MHIESAFPLRAPVGSTPFATVISCRGSKAKIGFAIASGIPGARATVGQFILVRQGKGGAVGMINEVSSGKAMASEGHEVVADIDLMGEIVVDAGGRLGFDRGVRHYPAIGDQVELLPQDALDLIQGSFAGPAIRVGSVAGDGTHPVSIDADGLYAKHFAVMGSTGVGKSSGTAVILNALVAARPKVRILLLDVHNEYTHCFDRRASVIDAKTLRLPFWLFNFDELTDAIYGGRPAVMEELDILAELIPVAKSTYSALKSGAERTLLTRRQTRQSGFTVDTPSPFLIQDLIKLIDERMGKLENRATRMVHHRLMTRIETVRNDPRYAFMFENANVGGDTMAQVLEQLFSVGTDRSGITLLKLAELPGEVVDAAVCVILRMAFEFGLWSDGGSPLLIVCEEAHRFASADPGSGFAPVRRILCRIAKEGRKYGVHLGLVTQRPAELDPTIVSQCSSLFMMRMANDRDQQLLRSAMADSAANLLNFLPSLGTGEVIAAGEAIALPMRFAFDRLPARQLPASDQIEARGGENGGFGAQDQVNRAIERWRKASSVGAGAIGSLDESRGGQDTETGQSAVNRALHAALRNDVGSSRF
ncbi:ATP-binding protein [Ensifer soli]|uniref:ATP-binding protein n=1 Tax=Ciceribacter sp. sgz301302 TaxID=3342379 RepID=UPI0035BB53E9